MANIKLKFLLNYFIKKHLIRCILAYKSIIEKDIEKGWCFKDKPMSVIDGMMGIWSGLQLCSLTDPEQPELCT